MTNQPKSVYMAGSVHHADDGGHGWRDDLRETYSDRFEWVNPLDKYDGNANDVIVSRKNGPRGYAVPEDAELVKSEEIVKADKRLIMNSDAVLVGWDPEIPACGTPMEVLFAWEQNIPVVVWLRGDGDLRDMSPWLDYHADYVNDTVAKCIEYLDSMVTSVLVEA